jgi:hypothetical protein
LIEDANGRLHGRPCRKRGRKASVDARKRKRATECTQTVDEIKFIQVSQVKQYVSAIVDLWKYQKDVVILSLLNV